VVSYDKPLVMKNTLNIAFKVVLDICFQKSPVVEEN